MSARDDTNDSTSSTKGACGMPRALVGEVLLSCQLVEENRCGWWAIHCCFRHSLWYP